MKRANLAGERFGSLLIVDRYGTDKNGHALWNATCDCGGSAIVRSNALLSRKQVHCADCIRANSLIIANRSTHRSWRAMLQRCTDKNCKDYVRYGALGITVCDQWLANFAAFLEHLGPRPIGTTLDRYPKREGNYEPGNVRWATAKEQARNRKNSKLTLDIAQEILGRFEHGEARKSISDRMKLSRTHVTSVINGSRWPELERPWRHEAVA